MEQLLPVIVGLIIVVVSILNERKRRQALAAAARRKQQKERRDEGGETEDDRQDIPDMSEAPGDSPAGGDLVGEILRRIAQEQERPGEPYGGLGDTEDTDEYGEQGARPEAPRVEMKHPKPTPVSERQEREETPEGFGKTPTYRPPLISDERTQGSGEGSGAAQREPSWKEPLIKTSSSTRSALSSEKSSSESAGKASQTVRAPIRSCHFPPWAHIGREQVRDGFIWAEILGKPRGLYDE